MMRIQTVPGIPFGVVSRNEPPIAGWFMDHGNPEMDDD